jgi:hypothetical protein
MRADNIAHNIPDRMDLLFVGLATFARRPACPDWDRLDGAGPKIENLLRESVRPDGVAAGRL